MATRPATRSTTSQSAQPSGASTSAPSTAPKSQKQMSKAERRELQEQQRVAKAQAQAKLGVAPKGAKTSQAQSQSTPGQGSTASNTRTSQAAESGASSTRQNRAQDKPRPPQDAGDPNQNPPSRGIRIFSHFGLPKQSTSAVKGDIHPSIISVGNKIGSFKITGANARCIAMLVAFKSVDSLVLELLTCLILRAPGHTRLCYPSSYDALATPVHPPLASNYLLSLLATPVGHDGQCNSVA